jgi:SNF family Na+-dependent transporter
MKHGDSIELYCVKCNDRSKYAVSNFKAKRSKLAIIIALSVFLIGTPCLLIVLWDTIWDAGLRASFGLIAVLVIPITVFRIINNNEDNRISIFNRS